MKKYIVKRNEVQIGTLEMPLDSQVILKDKNGKMFKGNKLAISNIAIQKWKNIRRRRNRKTRRRR